MIHLNKMSLQELPLKVMSYNIWFDMESIDERLLSLVKQIQALKPDVVCMQEVLSTKYAYLKKTLGYKYSYPETIKHKYGCAIFSNHPMVKARTLILPSNMGREMPMVKIEHNVYDTKDKTKILSTHEFVIFSFHFESEFDKRNIVKMMQYEMVSRIMNKLFKSHKNVIMCADTNVLIGEEPKFLKYFASTKDAWTMTGKNIDNKYTYDGLTNKNLKKRNIILQSRIDRIMYQSNGLIKPTNFELVTGLSNMIQPSDHYGILAEFRILHFF